MLQKELIVMDIVIEMVKSMENVRKIPKSRARNFAIALKYQNNNTRKQKNLQKTKKKNFNKTKKAKKAKNKAQITKQKLLCDSIKII